MGARPLQAWHFFSSTWATAQATAAQTASGNAPRIGLALGGGGAKGFAHIGVLEVLQEEGVPVDVVTGTSMGAVVGGLYAAGYPVEALNAIARERDWTALFSDAAGRRLQPLERRVSGERFLLLIPLGKEGGVALPTGFIAGQRISQLLTRLLLPVSGVRDFAKLPTPFGAVATNLETGEGVLFTEGYLPQVIRASMAIPSVFTPTEIEGATYIDGGVARNLPAEDARRLGADLVICSDVGDPLLPADSLASFVDVLMQAMWYRADASTQAQIEECDVTIKPDISGLTTFSFDQAGEIIERGRAAAEAVRAQLAALADSAGHAPRERDRIFELDEERAAVAAVRVEGLAPLVARRVRAALGIEPPAQLTAEELDAAVERTYATGLFERVTYRLEPEPDGDVAVLVVEAERRTQERIGIGLRYDSPYKAAILLSASLRDRLGVGATTEVSLRLGEALRLGGRYNVPISLAPRLGLALEAEATRVPIDLFSSGERTSSVRAEVLSGGAQLGSIFLSDFAAAIGVRGEAFSIEQEVGGDDIFSDPEGLVLGEAFLYLDTFDRTAFATRGVQALLRSSVADEAILSSFSFSQHVLDGEVRVPLASRLTAIGRLVLGRSFGDGLPLHRRFYLGGATPYGLFPDRQFALLGYDVQELSGRIVQAVGLGMQAELPGDLFAFARWNAARVAEDWDWSPEADAFQSGFGLTLGAATPLGPVELTGMGREAKGPYEVQLSVGYTF